MNICIYGASSAAIDKHFLEVSEEMGRMIAARGHVLYFGGGASGVMGAAARGAYAEGGQIVSVVPSFFNVDGILFEPVSDIIYTETMGERKQVLEDHSDAFIAMPGGIGTYDEFFGCITNKQLGIHNKAVAVFNADHYFDPLETLLEHTMKAGFMKSECRSLFRFFKDCGTLLDHLESYVPEDNPFSFFKDVGPRL